MGLRRWIAAGGACALLALPVVGCGDSDGSSSDPAPVTLRVAHAALEAPAVDVYVRGVDTPLFEAVGYGGVTPFRQTDPATVVVDIRAAGAEPSSAPVFSSDALTLPAGETVTVLAAGVLGSTDAVDAFRLIPIVEGFAPVDPGTIRVRAIHTAVDAPTVALDVGDDGSVEVPEFPLYGDTGAEGIALPANEAIRIGVRLTEADGGARVTSFTTPALPEGLELIVVATGFLAELPREVDSFSLLAISPDGAAGLIAQDPSVQVLHAAPDVVAVDLGSGGVPLASDLRFAEITEALQLPPGSYDIDISPAGAPEVLTTVTTPALEAGQRYLAVAGGFLEAAEGEGSFEVSYYPDGLVADPEAASVQLIHLAPDVPPVDVGVVDGMDFSVVVPDFAYGEVTAPEGLALPAMMLEVGVALAGTGMPVLSFDLGPAAGQTAFGVVAGALTPSATREELRLILVDTTAGLPWTAAELFPN